MALLIFIKLIIFWAIIAFFAWRLMLLIFKDESNEFLLTLALIAGPVFYIFTLNILGHFFPITFLFFYVLAAFLIIGLVLFIFTHKDKIKSFWLLDKRWRKILLLTIIVIFLTTGLIAARGYSGDEFNIFSTVPMAGTIAEGNFPVRWTVEPQVMAYYHYGIELFSAAMYKTTGLPFWYGVDLCRALFTILFLALIFLVLFKITKHPAKSYLVSLLTLFGGGLVWIYGITGFIHRNAAAPWKFLHQGTTSGAAGPLIRDIHIQWGAISFLLIALGIFLYFKAVEYKKENKSWLPIVLFNIISLSVLALVGETYLLVELVVILLYPFITLFIKSQKKYFKTYLLISLLTMAAVALIAAFQGGVLTELFHQSYDRHPRPTGNWFFFNHEKIGFLWSSQSLINFGLPLFLILPCLYLLYVRFRKGEYYQELLFLLLLSFACFAVPFVMELGPRYDYEMLRYLYLAPPFWSLAIGLVLADILIDNQRVKKIWQRLGWLVVFLMMLVGLLFQIIFMVVPIGRSSQRLSPFFYNFPPPTAIESRAFAWIKKNTTINDYFFSYSPSQDDSTIYNKKMNIFAGRIAPVYSYMADHKMLNRDQLVQDLIAAFGRAEISCLPADLKFMGYKYLYVSEHWPAGLEEQCQANNKLELKYEDSENGSFARIYKINY